MEPKVLTAVRFVVGSVWLYEGLYMKLLARDPHELSIVSAVGAPLGLTAQQFLFAIGTGETLLAFAVFAGWFARPLALLQAFLLFSMNVVGVFLGQGRIEDPAGLLVRNGPLFLLFFLLGRYGAGAYTVPNPLALLVKPQKARA